MAVDERKELSGTVSGEHYRFTVLTSRLIRMEYAPDGIFEDRPTQIVACRDFLAPDYRVWHTDGGGIEIHTEHVSVFYDGQAFSAHGLWAENRSECRGIYCTWHFGDTLAENLGGTARTLDRADGAVPIENGIQSRLQGFSILDDSHSFVLTEDGWFAPRACNGHDLYFFSYGYAYRQALKDYFHLCGPTPLLPRYALGNWWSRFHAYSDVEYLALMDRFAAEGVPLSVAVVDMDWHITNPEGGKGWTGYAWDRSLFPDPPAFLQKLHGRGLKTTLNLHPAEGVQTHEEVYPAMAEALGKDAKRGQRIPFDPGDRMFMRAYFDLLHRPREAEGVDFWWVDWQQGTTATVAGLDPLWALNHLHTQHSTRGGKRGLILSRYAGPGSHRYPIGFSGDSVISWRSLQFQPYFTATAANIGYGWWSHDIGGHAYGKRDDELQVRWLQLGVFSPVLRLHSTSNPFCGKEPWRYGDEVRGIMDEYLRLRHRLIPYLYSMNHRCHREGEPLVQPMYYAYPQVDEAYRVPNQYLFGSELMVAPITQPMDTEARLASVTAWLPEGTWFDCCNGLRIEGNRKIALWRSLSQMPVLAKAGAILPLTGELESRQNGVELPQSLEIRVFGGADGDFALYEDDGETMAYEAGEKAVTRFALRWRMENTTRFTMRADGGKPFLPKRRDYVIAFLGVEDNDMLSAFNGEGVALPVETGYSKATHRLAVNLRGVPCGTAVELVFAQPLTLADNDVLPRCNEILNNAQIEYELKGQAERIIQESPDERTRMSNLLALGLPQAICQALMEILLA